MSSSTEMLQLQLGDIIQVESNKWQIEDKIFLITYIDTKQIEVQDITTLAKTTLLLDSEENSSTEASTVFLSKSWPGTGICISMDLPKVWVTITLGGDLPVHRSNY